MSAAAVTDNELDRLPIFPLHGVALFPNTLVPLHVFEPRYRRLVEDCLEKDLPLAVWQLDPARPTDHGPGIRSVATAGRIVVHHRLPEGRLNVVVEGVERVRLLEELATGEPYRTVRSCRHPLAPLDERAAQSRLTALRAIAWQLYEIHPRAARLVDVTLRRTLDVQEISDVLCSVTFDDGAARQHLLEQSDVIARLDRVLACLSETLLGDRPEPPSESGPAPAC